jgi:hypothetical protein
MSAHCRQPFNVCDRRMSSSCCQTPAPRRETRALTSGRVVSGRVRRRVRRSEKRLRSRKRLKVPAPMSRVWRVEVEEEARKSKSFLSVAVSRESRESDLRRKGGGGPSSNVAGTETAPTTRCYNRASGMRPSPLIVVRESSSVSRCSHRDTHSAMRRSTCRG